MTAAVLASAAMAISIRMKNATVRNLRLAWILAMTGLPARRVHSNAHPHAKSTIHHAKPNRRHIAVTVSSTRRQNSATVQHSSSASLNAMNTTALAMNPAICCATATARSIQRDARKNTLRLAAMAYSMMPRKNAMPVSSSMETRPARNTVHHSTPVCSNARTAKSIQAAAALSKSTNAATANSMKMSSAMANSSSIMRTTAQTGAILHPVK